MNIACQRILHCILTGRPYFVTSNNATQYSILNQRTVLTVDIVTFENVIGAALFADKMKICDSSSIQSPVSVRDTMYGNTVIVQGSTLMFTITTKTDDDFRQYTVVVDNAKGSSSYLVTLKPARKYLLNIARHCTKKQASMISNMKMNRASGVKDRCISDEFLILEYLSFCSIFK